MQKVIQNRVKRDILLKKEERHSPYVIGHPDSKNDLRFIMAKSIFRHLDTLTSFF